MRMREARGRLDREAVIDFRVTQRLGGCCVKEKRAEREYL